MVAVKNYPNLILAKTCPKLIIKIQLLEILFQSTVDRYEYNQKMEKHKKSPNIIQINFVTKKNECVPRFIKTRENRIQSKIHNKIIYVKILLWEKVEFFYQKMKNKLVRIKIGEMMTDSLSLR